MLEGKMPNDVRQQAVAAAGPGPSWTQIAAAGTLAALCVAIFWSFFRRQVIWAIQEQADWGHTLIIPAIAAYFVYLRREQLLAAPFRTTWFGLVPVVAGVAIYVVCSVGPLPLQHHNLQGLGAWITITGVVLLFFGWRAMRWLWFPLAYAFAFGQSVSNRFMTIVTYPLQDITAKGSFFVLKIGGFDIEWTGNTLTLFDGGRDIPLNVAEACSGMRMLMAFLALGVAMAYIGLPFLWQRVVLVLLAVPTAIAINILRVVTLALLSRYDTDFAAGDFHTFIGLVWLVPAFFMYVGLLAILSRLVVDQSGRPVEARS